MPLLHRESAAAERLRGIELALILQQKREVVQRLRDVRVVRPEILLINRQGAAVQRLGDVGLTLRL